MVCQSNKGGGGMSNGQRNKVTNSQKAVSKSAQKKARIKPTLLTEVGLCTARHHWKPRIYKLDKGGGSMIKG